MMNVKIGTILAFLTHDDPLSAETVAAKERGPRDAVDILHNNAKRYGIRTCFALGTTVAGVLGNQAI